MTRRRLSDDERVLWRGVTRSIMPLHPESAAPAEPAPVKPARGAAEPSRPSKSRSANARPVGPAPPPPARPPMPSPVALDRKLKGRIARGREPLDGRLDLHGMIQAEAHAALHRFLQARQARGDTMVLVITGKGQRGEAGAAERGVLRRMVPLWLGMPELRAMVVGFESASVRHGGDGALYVRLRRRKAL